jgi:hypothetical protein
MPGVQLTPHVVDLADLLPAQPDPADRKGYLLPCRGGGMAVPGAAVSYLDEVPPRADWMLLGCARSRAIHDFFYDGPVRQIDTCPRTLAARVDVPAGEVLVTKCCLFEDRNELEGRTVATPWGASYGQLREALATAVGIATAPEPAGRTP